MVEFCARLEGISAGGGKYKSIWIKHVSCPFTIEGASIFFVPWLQSQGIPFPAPEEQFDALLQRYAAEVGTLNQK